MDELRFKYTPLGTTSAEVTFTVDSGDIDMSAGVAVLLSLLTVYSLARSYGFVDGNYKTLQMLEKTYRDTVVDASGNVTETDGDS